MEVIGVYSNLPDQAQRLRRLLELSPQGRSGTQSRTSRQAQTRLSADELDRLATAYFHGAKISELAEKHGINRTTVMEHIARLGLPRRYPRLGPEDTAEALQRQLAGESLTSIGRSFGVPASTIKRTLERWS